MLRRFGDPVGERVNLAVSQMPAGTGSMLALESGPRFNGLNRDSPHVMRSLSFSFVHCMLIGCCLASEDLASAMIRYRSDSQDYGYVAKRVESEAMRDARRSCAKRCRRL
jgi:hypothetical protein